METNYIAILIRALADQKAVVPPSNLVLVLTAIGPLIAALAVWFSRNAALNTDKIKVSTDATAVSVEAAHKAINAERTATLAEVRDLKAEVLKLSEKLAFKEGQKVIAPKPTGTVTPILIP